MKEVQQWLNRSKREINKCKASQGFLSDRDLPHLKFPIGTSTEQPAGLDGLVSGRDKTQWDSEGVY